MLIEKRKRQQSNYPLSLLKIVVMGKLLWTSVVVTGYSEISMSVFKTSSVIYLNFIVIIVLFHSIHFN